jgi:hypothetical protein
MMIILFGLLAFILGALGRRAAGGLVQDLTGKDIGDLPVRLFYGLTVALAALMGGSMLWVPVLMLPAVFVGTTTGNFDSMSMGHGTYTKWHDYLGMTCHGFLSALLPALVTLLAGHVLGAIGVFLAITLLATPSYLVGWSLYTPTSNASWPLGFRPPTPLAEFLWGGLTSLSVYIAFVL